VGEPHDHRALEAELGDRALQFIGRGARIGRRQGGKSGEAIRMRTHRFVQVIVRAPRQPHRAFRVEILGRRRGLRHHLKIDAGLVHLADAQRAHVTQTLGRPRLAVPRADQLGRPEMLFEGDDVR
jgi:hypothetical protein